MANTNTGIFLVVTLMYAVSILLYIFLIGGEIKQNFPVMLCFMLVTTVGLVSCRTTN